MLLPFVYDWTGTDTLSAVAWDHAKWHPDVVVMNLGTNDFASGVVDSAEFVNVAVDFVQRIRSYHPEAKIVLLDGPMLLGDCMVKCREFLDVVKLPFTELLELVVRGQVPDGKTAIAVLQAEKLLRAEGIVR